MEHLDDANTYQKFDLNIGMKNKQKFEKTFT